MRRTALPHQGMRSIEESDDVKEFSIEPPLSERFSEKDTIRETEDMRKIMEIAIIAKRRAEQLAIREAAARAKAAHLKTSSSSNSSSRVAEGFTSSGKLLGDPEEVLYMNKFIDTSISEDLPVDDKERFRKYHDEQSVKNTNTNTNMNTTATATETASKGSDRFNKPLNTVVTIDSGDRDMVRYPDANNFKIELRQQYRNIKSIRIISTEFPNTDQVVKASPADQKNNRIYWINDEDADEDYDCLVYNADITAGNYTANSLSIELEETIGTVNRYSDDTPHEFLVSVDTDTDIAEFQSIQSTILSLDPISTTEASNLLVVTHPSHGFVTGNEVVIANSTSVGGIGALVINDTHIVTASSENTYNVRVSSIATTTASGGGANVLSGRNKPYMMLFSNLDTLGTVLGFPQQDSSYHIATEISEIDITPDNLELNTEPPTLYANGEVPARFTTSTPHKLTIGDVINIQNTDTIPTINGEQTVTEIISDTEFEIGVVIKIVNNQSTFTNTELGEVIESIDSAATDAISISEYAESFLSATGNGLVAADNIYIDDMVTTPDINGLQTVSDILTADNFRIGIDILDCDSIPPESESTGVYVIPTTGSTVPIGLNKLLYDNTGLLYTNSPVSLSNVWVYDADPTNVPDLNGSASGVLSVPRAGITDNMEVHLNRTYAIVSVVGSTVTTSSPHGMTGTDTVVISGNSGSIPNINGSHPISGAAGSTFTIPIVTTTGAGGGLVTPPQVDTITKVTSIGSQSSGQSVVAVEVGDTAFTVGRVIRENRGMLGSSDHGLSNNELVFVSNSDTLPDINDVRTVSIIDGDYFESDLTITAVNSITANEQYVHTTDAASTPITEIIEQNPGLMSTSVNSGVANGDIIYNIGSALENPSTVDEFQTVDNEYGTTRKFSSLGVNIGNAAYTVSSITAGNPTILDFSPDQVPAGFRIDGSYVVRGCNEPVLNGTFDVSNISGTLLSVDVDSTATVPTICNIHKPGKYFRTEDKGTGTEGTNGAEFGRIESIGKPSRIESVADEAVGVSIRIEGYDLLDFNGGDMVLMNGTGTSLDGTYLTATNLFRAANRYRITVPGTPALLAIDSGIVSSDLLDSIVDDGGSQLTITMLKDHYLEQFDTVVFKQSTAANQLNGRKLQTISVAQASDRIFFTAGIHGYNVGDTVTITGVVGSTPPINGTHTVTNVNSSHTWIKIGVDITVAGFGGTCQLEGTDITGTVVSGDTVNTQINIPDHTFEVGETVTVSGASLPLADGSYMVMRSVPNISIDVSLPFAGIAGAGGIADGDAYIEYSAVDVPNSTTFNINFDGGSDDLSGTFVATMTRTGNVTILRTRNNHNLVVGNDIYFDQPFTSNVAIVSTTAGSPCTVTTDAPHNLLIGQTVKLSESDVRNLNEKNQVTELVSDTSFRIEPLHPGSLAGGAAGIVTGMTYPVDIGDSVVSVATVIDDKRVRLEVDTNGGLNNLTNDYSNDREWMYSTFSATRNYNTVYSASDNLIESGTAHGIDQSTTPNIYIADSITAASINGINLASTIIDATHLSVATLVSSVTPPTGSPRFVTTTDSAVTMLDQPLTSLSPVEPDANFGYLNVEAPTTYLPGDRLFVQDTSSSSLDNLLHTIAGVINSDTFVLNTVIASVFTTGITGTGASTITVSDPSPFRIGDAISVYDNSTENGTYLVSGVAGSVLTVDPARPAGTSDGTVLLDTRGLAIRSRDPVTYSLSRIIAGTGGFYTSDSAHGLSTAGETIYINGASIVTTATPLLTDTSPSYSPDEFTISGSIGSNATLEVAIVDEFIATSSVAPIALVAHREMQGGIEYSGADVWSVGEQVFVIPYRNVTDDISGVQTISFVDTVSNLIEFSGVSVTAETPFDVNDTIPGSTTFVGSENHTFQIGDTVLIVGNSNPSVNGSHVISGSIPGVSFVIPVATGFAGAGGTVTLDPDVPAKLFHTAPGAILDTINSVSTGSPTVITANSHGMTVGSSTTVYVQNTNTTPGINGFHSPSEILDTNNIELTGVGPVTANNSIIRLNRPASFSKQVIQSNAGSITAMAAGAVTTITTDSRPNSHGVTSFPISRSIIGSPGGLAVTGTSFSAGDEVTVSGQQGGDEYLDGIYTIGTVVPDTSLAVIAVRVGSPTTVVMAAAHGLIAGDYVRFGGIDDTITPSVNNQFLIDATPAADEIQLLLSTTLQYQITTSEVSATGTVNAPGHTYQIGDTVNIVGSSSYDGSYLLAGAIVPGVSFDIGVAITVAGVGGVAYGPAINDFATGGTMTGGASFTLLGTTVTVAGELGTVTGPSEPIAGHGLRSASGTISAIGLGQPTTLTVNDTSELVSGRSVLISGSDSVPSLDGDRQILEVLSPTSFSIDGVNVVSVGTTGTWDYGDIVIIRDIDTEPDITNRQLRVTVLNDTMFTVPFETTFVDQTQILNPNNCQGRAPPTWGSNILTIELCDHGLVTNDMLFLYGTEQIGLIPEQNINTSHGNKRNRKLTRDERVTRKYVRYVDDNHFEVGAASLLTGTDNELRSFAYNRELGGGYFVCISATGHTNADKLLGMKNYGFASTQSNESCNGLLNRIVDLDGDGYVFIVSEPLKTIVNSNDRVENAFAKILLNEKPGTRLYNTYVSSSKDYEDPLRVLDTLEFQVVRPNGKTFNFLGSNWSISLEIREYFDRLRYTNVSATRGVQDRGLASQYGSYTNSAQEDDNYYLNNDKPVGRVMPTALETEDYDSKDGNLLGIGQLLQDKYAIRRGSRRSTSNLSGQAFL